MIALTLLVATPLMALAAEAPAPAADVSPAALTAATVTCMSAMRRTGVDASALRRAGWTPQRARSGEGLPDGVFGTRESSAKLLPLLTKPGACIAIGRRQPTQDLRRYADALATGIEAKPLPSGKNFMLVKAPFIIKVAEPEAQTGSVVQVSIIFSPEGS